MPRPRWPAQVEQLLDLLPDLTHAFEIVVVDDGSTDHTVDLARELAREYPQVRLIWHTRAARRRGRRLKTGLQWAQGQTVFVQEDPAAVSPTDLRRLWSLRHDRGRHAVRAAGLTSSPPRCWTGFRRGARRYGTWPMAANWQHSHDPPAR